MTTVRDFNHTLLWPVQLRLLRRGSNISTATGAGIEQYWEVLKKNPGSWKYVEDALLIEDESCQTGYEEFVYFLPYVQRFLYGWVTKGVERSLHCMFLRATIL